jgi:SPOR domain
VSDITVPSWRPQTQRSGPPLRLLAIAGGVLGIAALGGAVAWGVSRMGPRPVPVIEADSRPLKIRPENPGGMIVANQDQLVLEPPAVRRAAERSQGATARLDTGPEAPALEQLRQQAAPPAPPAIAVLPAPAAAPVALPPIAGVPAAIPAPPAPVPAPMAPPPGASALGMPAAAPGAIAPPVAAPPAPAAGSFKPVSAGRVQVQLGALATEEAAKAEWDRLVVRIPDLGTFQPRIIRLDREGQPTLWRLRTGPFGDPAVARSLCEAVRARGGNCVAIGA